MLEVKVSCNVYRCFDDCDEHAYCDGHMKEKLEASFEEGREQGFDEGYEKAKKEFEVIE